MSERWQHVEIVLSDSIAEAVCAYLHELDVGALVEESLPEALTRFTYATCLLAGVPAQVARLADYVKSLQVKPGQNLVCQITHYAVPDRDWSSQWKASFHPIEIDSGLWVKPSWESLPDSAAGITIEIDPGRAFGVGSHETTRLCLKALKRIVSARPLGNVLDVGTGTGILAIAAAKLGASSVTAVDTDPLALEAACANAEHNGVSAIIALPAKQLREITETYDVILANLTAQKLTRLASLLSDRVRAGGRLIVSGLLVGQQLEDIQKRYALLGFTESEPSAEGEWCAVVFWRGASVPGS